MLSEKITELRKSHNLTQKEFAEKLNVAQQAVSKWERGKGMPDTVILIDIARKFGASLDELLEVKSDAEIAEPSPEEENDERDYEEIVNLYVKDGMLDLDDLRHSDKDYSYGAVEKAVNGLPVCRYEAYSEYLKNKDYRNIFKYVLVNDRRRDRVLRNLLADNTEYVDYFVERYYLENYKNQISEAEQERKQFLIRYALRLTQKHDRVANREELEGLLSSGQIKEFIKKAFDRLVFVLRMKKGSDASADDIVGEYLKEVEYDCDYDGDCWETEQHRIVTAIDACRKALDGGMPMPKTDADDLLRFIEIIEEVEQNA